MNVFHTILQNVMWHEFKRIAACVLFGTFELWLSCSVFAGGSSHRKWSETAHTSYVSFLQQAQEQVLLSLGSWHYLKEKNKSPSQYQPGLWGFTVFLKSFKAINITAWPHKDYFYFFLNIYHKFFWSYDHLTFFLSQQVFADGEEPVKKPVDGIYVDPAKEHTVRSNHYLFFYAFHSEV